MIQRQLAGQLRCEKESSSNGCPFNAHAFWISLQMNSLLVSDCVSKHFATKECGKWLAQRKSFNMWVNKRWAGGQVNGWFEPQSVWLTWSLPYWQFGPLIVSLCNTLLADTSMMICPFFADWQLLEFLTTMNGTLFEPFCSLNTLLNVN